MSAPVDDRLAQFREEWPRRVTWREVGEADAGVFVRALGGAALLVLAAVTGTAAFWALSGGLPRSWRVPEAFAGALPFLAFLLILVTMGLAVTGLVHLVRPFELRRLLAFRRFARERDLNCSLEGLAPVSRGVFFAEPRETQRATARLRSGRRGKLTGAGDTRPRLFGTRFALWRASPGWEPGLQIAVARYRGGKSDPKGPRNAFRFLQLRLPRTLPHLLLDSRSNGRIRGALAGAQRISLEGDFDRWFVAHAPGGYERDALEILTPDVMAGLIDYGRHWDIEVVDDLLIVVSNRFRRGSDRDETTAMLHFSETVAEALSHQTRTYSDPRADRPRSEVAPAGRRLRRVSAVWATAIGVAVIAVWLGSPLVVNWLLDLN